MADDARTSVFGGGCFWGVDKLFRDHFKERTIGITPGYAGGSTKNPKYEEVCTEKTGHVECVRIIHQSSKVGYKELAEFLIHDPLQKDGQGPDIGSRYVSTLLYRTPQEENDAREALNDARKRFGGAELATQIIPYETFYEAEDYHKNYIDRHPGVQMCTTHYLRNE